MPWAGEERLGGGKVRRGTEGRRKGGKKWKGKVKMNGNRSCRGRKDGETYK